MPSTFNSSVLGSAYYYRGRGAARTVCRSTGFSLLFSLQSTVFELLQELGVGMLPSAGGSTITIDQLGVINVASPSAGPGWDDTTLRALYAFVQFSSQQPAANRTAIAAYLPSISADILRRSGNLSERTMRAAVWAVDSRSFNDVGERVYGIGSPDNVSFDSGATFPVYGQIPPVPSNGTAVAGPGDCFPIAEGEVARDPVTTTATFGVDVGLLLFVLAAGVIGIATTTRERKNPGHRPETQPSSNDRWRGSSWGSYGAYAQKKASR